MIEWVTGRKPDEGGIKAVLFDFDGTLSALRGGWETVMEPMMIEILGIDAAADVHEYIDASCGIQTVYQMRWLAECARKSGQAETERDEWQFKDEYNRRLMAIVGKRKDNLTAGVTRCDDYLIGGAVGFLAGLRAAGLRLYAASGTDDEDVRREAKLLGLSEYFEIIEGAPTRRADCSKEAVIKMLLESEGLKGAELAVVGDGKVEIALGVAVGGYTIGVASDEYKRVGVNPQKRARLIKAGADIVIGDFSETNTITNWLLGIKNDENH